MWTFQSMGCKLCTLLKADCSKLERRIICAQELEDKLGNITSLLSAFHRGA